MGLVTCGGSGSSSSLADSANNQGSANDVSEDVQGEDLNEGEGSNDNGVINPEVIGQLRVAGKLETDGEGVRQSTTAQQYDEQGRVVQTVQTLFEPDGVTVDGISTNIFIYDDHNRIARVDNETLFTEGSVISESVILTYVDDVGVQLESILMTSEDVPNLVSTTLLFTYIGDRVQRAVISGPAVIGNEVQSISVDFTISHNGPNRLISQIDKTSSSVSLSSNNNVGVDSVVTITYQNDELTQLEEIVDGDVVINQSVVRTVNQDIVQSEFLGGHTQIVTIEYEEGVCLPQDTYLAQVTSLINILSRLPDTQCRNSD